SEHEKESDADKEKKSADEATFKDLLIKVKAALGDKVTEVRLSERLTTSPSCIVSDEGQMSSHMQRILRQAGQAVNNQPTLELNPHHLLVLRLKDEQDVQHFHDLSEILLDQAILAEGGQLDDPGSFVKRFNELLLNVAHKGNGSLIN
ncbi:MAG TPA: molecular chaperone HtpG, partial [Candidatus Berkiella sp.]|nr:molecular chaperone HtpG [Candidatus Berkiella sp.]